jgi:hypothetical protein
MNCSQFSSSVSSTCIYQAIRNQILTPLIYLLFAVALVYFIFGVVRYLLAERKGDQPGKEKGRHHMLYGALGMAIMISVFGIMQFIWGTIAGFGLTQGITGKTVAPPSEINGL